MAKKPKDIHSMSGVGNVIGAIVIGIFALACIIPFFIVIMISFTDEKSLAVNGYRMIPKKFSVEAYRYIFKTGSQILTSYGITILITVIGTLTALIIISLYAYAISRKDFKGRKFCTFFAFFTMLFNGGLVPFYLVITQVLGVKNTIWAVILPMCCSAWYIIILRTFFSTSVPEAIIESARIDGANEFRTFLQIVLPISLPGLATIALFSTLGYWNDWFNAMLFIDKNELVPLQYLLIKMENSMEFFSRNLEVASSADGASALANLPKETAKMAMVVLAVGPIVFAYPFFQKYFVQGLTIGAVKE